MPATLGSRTLCGSSFSLVSASNARLPQRRAESHSSVSHLILRCGTHTMVPIAGVFSVEVESMSNTFVVDGENFENDALRGAVKNFKDAMRKVDQDLDVDFLLKTLGMVNEHSAVKVARNPVDANHEWISGTKLHNIGKVEVDDEFHLLLHIRHDGAECTAEKLLEHIEVAKKKMHATMGPVMLQVSDSKKVQITDVFSHSLVKDMYAGVPFDVVLGYFEDDPE